MTVTGSRPRLATKIGSYIGANMALRRAIHQNAADFHAVHEDGTQLCYFVDANIVQWYLDPLDNFTLVSALMRQETIEQGQGIELGSNVIAAEYIFSKRLIGSDGFAPFLTPFHADELHETFERKLLELLLSAKTDLPGEDVRSASGALVKAYDSFKYRHSLETLSALFSAFTDVLEHAYGSIAHRRQRTRKLFQDKRVIRASEFGDFGLDDSYLKNYATWEDLLVQAGKPSSDTRKIKRDASSLCLIERLNYDAMKEARPIRFLMITADSHVHDAVDNWRRTEDLLGIGQLDFLRHPRQYIPIINLNSMRADAEHTIMGFSELMKSVDDISFSIYHEGTIGTADAVHVTSSHFPDRFNRVIRSEVSEAMIARLAPKVEELSERWQSALETSVLMNADMVAGMVDEFVTQSIKPLADSRELDDFLRQQISDDIHQISSGHIEFAARGQLLAQLRAIRRAKGVTSAARGITRHARSPSLARLRVPSALAEMARMAGESVPADLSEFLGEYVLSHDKTAIDEFETALGGVTGVEAATIACVLCFRLSQWEQARYLAERLIHAIGREDTEYYEIEYLRIVSDRFSGMSLENLQKNGRILDIQMQRCGDHNDDYGYVRAISEKAAQCLFYGYTQALITEQTRRAPNRYIWSTIYDAEGYLDKALRAFNKAEESRRFSQINPAVVKQLRVQILANWLSAFFFIKFHPIPVDDSRRNRQSLPPGRLVDELYELVASREKVFRLAEFYALCARKELGDRRWGAHEEARMRVLLATFLRDRSHFEEIDRREVNWMRNVLGLDRP